MKTHILTSLLLFTSCAAIEKQWVADNCDADAAYSKGVEDAQNGEEHNARGYSLCGKADQGKFKAAYSKGYNSAKNNPMSLIKDAIGLNYYTCEMSPFVETFTASGRNLGRVKAQVKQKCLAKNDPMHCDEVSCQKN